ncbi:common central domain of tyrosinase domain-containing protein [Ditylenchus destructor]|nr:common central domain of tyrosinase domain-containing protein [Ditylenchus destructor]
MHAGSKVFSAFVRKQRSKWTPSSYYMGYIILAFYLPLTEGQMNCAEAPTAAARIVCEQLHKWDTNARSAPPVTTKVALPPAIPGLPAPMMAAELAPIASSPYQCMDLGCLCSYMGGNGQQGSNACTLSNGRPLAKALRKEYRMLSDDERNRFHAALRQLKNSGEYDRISVIHSQFATAGGAHSGPAFLSWHREYIKRIEIAIRQVDPTLALPYWDSVLDNNLPNPRDSILWTPEFMGGSDAAGNVNSGPFTPWRTISGRANVLRHVGAQGTLFQEREIAYILQQTQIENVLAFTSPRQGCMIRTDWNVLEYTHGNVHIFVGGDMLDQSTSANDPIFYLHHSFVDLIWELWRQQRQTRFDRENAYPMDMQLCSSAQHFGSALMRPFEPWRNVDGLNNKYTDNMYEYAPRPSCASGGNCGSPYLFCDRSHGAPRCAAKVRVGGSCAGFTAGETACHNGVCQGGKCVAAGPQPIPTTPRPPPVTAAPPTSATENCFNEHECCAIWGVKGECNRNPGYMNAWCKASCGQCRPRYDIRAECSDRHVNCAKWSRSGECTKNSFWMAENCRQSCNKCTATRAQICSGAVQQQKTTTPPPPTQTQQMRCTSPGCFNENICCQIWGLQGQCVRNAGWMSCNCRISCGYCIPTDYPYGTCDDYHNDCPTWSQRGECGKNPWMLENCRLSCRTCLSNFELRQMCRVGGGRRGRRQSRLALGSDIFRVERDTDYDNNELAFMEDFMEGSKGGMPAPVNNTIVV